MAKAVLRGKFKAVSAFIKKSEIPSKYQHMERHKKGQDRN
jgi:hypothetical protein